MLKLPHSVITRDGQREPFQLERVTSAICQIGRASGEFSATEAERLAELTMTVLSLRQNGQPTVEQIQDGIEQTLLASGYFRSARAYIVHREQHSRLRKDRQTVTELEASINAYLDRSDWRGNGVPQAYSLGGLVLHLAGRLSANYWLSHVYPPDVEQAHRGGDLHVHALDTLAGYCAGWSLRQLLDEGFNGVPGQVQAGPPQHLASAVGQIINFIGAVQNEWAGAQTLSSVDTWLAPFVRKDALSYAEVRQCMQELIFNLNVPTRWGSRPPFTILTFDWVCPPDLRQQPACVGGTALPFCHGDLQEEMLLINRAYMDVLRSGDTEGGLFVFPLTVCNVGPDFPWDDPATEGLFELTARYGLPTFINYVSSGASTREPRSFKERHQLDLSQLLHRGSGLFGSAEHSGSVGVVTINCARIGYLFRGDEAGLFRHVDRMLELARVSLEVKRSTVQRLMDQGLYPYTRRYLASLRNHFSTVGVNGVNEMIRNLTADREDISSPWGTAFAQRLLQHIRARLVQFQQQTGHLYNLEASPAERACDRFAREDARRFPGILQAGSLHAPYYTNSTQLPAGYTDDLFQALEHQQELQEHYTGGTAMHLYMQGPLSSTAACRALVRRIVHGYRLPCISITPTFSICPSHGYLPGAHEFCPHCDEERLQRQAGLNDSPLHRSQVHDDCA